MTACARKGCDRPAAWLPEVRFTKAAPPHRIERPMVCRLDHVPLCEGCKERVTLAAALRAWPMIVTAFLREGLPAPDQATAELRWRSLAAAADADRAEPACL